MRSAEPANAAGLEKSAVRSSPGQVDFLAGRGNCPHGSKKWPWARQCESCLPIGQAWIYPWDTPAQIFFQSSPVCSWAGLAKTTRGYVAWYLEFKVADSSVVSWVNPCKGGFWTCLAVGIIWKVSTYLHLIIDNDLLTMLTMFTFNLMVWWYNLSSAAGVTFFGFKSRP